MRSHGDQITRGAPEQRAVAEALPKRAREICFKSRVLRRRGEGRRLGIPDAARDRLIGIVDDDPSVCRALSRLLTAAGFAVETFLSGYDLLHSDALGAMSAVILDVNAGALTGLAVQQRLAAMHPSLPVVFITGGHQVPDPSGFGSPSCLRKPFEADDLIAAVHEALSAPE